MLQTIARSSRLSSSAVPLHEKAEENEKAIVKRRLQGCFCSQLATAFAQLSALGPQIASVINQFGQKP